MESIPLRSIAIRDLPNPLICTWVSIKPGMTVFPFKSIIFVFLFTHGLISLFVPTSTIFSYFMAIAWARGCSGFMVMMLPFIKTRSADPIVSTWCYVMVFWYK